MTLSDNKFIGFNMIVAKDKVFDDYSKTIFDILGKYHDYMNENIPDNIRNNAMLRDSGYIAELLTDSYHSFIACSQYKNTIIIPIKQVIRNKNGFHSRTLLYK